MMMMDLEAEKRAQMRRQSWTGGRSSNADLVEMERELWRTACSSLRFDTIWEMALEAWHLKKGDQIAPRLQGAPVGIRKRER